MAIFDVDVRKITAGGTTAADFLSALSTALTAGTKFTVEGSDANGFWFSCDKAGENWQGALSDDAGDIDAAIDPNATFTSSTGVSDTSQWSGVELAVDFGSTRSADFYLIELPDAFFVLWLNASTSKIEEALHIGNIFTAMPFQHPVETLGWLADNITETTSGWFLQSSFGSKNYVYEGSALWGEAFFKPAGSQMDAANGDRIPGPMIMNMNDVDGSSDRYDAAFLKYCFVAPEKDSKPPGDFQGNGTDTFCHVYTGTTSDFFIIPWDSAVTPDFA